MNTLEVATAASKGRGHACRDLGLREDPLEPVGGPHVDDAHGARAGRAVLFHGSAHAAQVIAPAPVARPDEYAFGHGSEPMEHADSLLTAPAADTHDTAANAVLGPHSGRQVEVPRPHRRTV